MKNLTLRYRLDLVRHALTTCAPDLSDVDDFEEFPFNPTGKDFDKKKILTEKDIHLYRSIKTSTMAFYDGKLAFVVMFRSPTLDCIDHDDMINFFDCITPLMPNLNRYQIANEVRAFVLTLNDLLI